MIISDLNVPLPVNDGGDATISNRTVPPVSTGFRDSSQMEMAQSGDANLKSLVKEANQVLSRFTSMDFDVDRDLGKTVVRVRDSHTKEVVRQIPNEEMLALSKKIRTVQGLLFDLNI